jgi:hypothetical protein
MPRQSIHRGSKIVNSKSKTIAPDIARGPRQPAPLRTTPASSPKKCSPHSAGRDSADSRVGAFAARFAAMRDGHAKAVVKQRAGHRTDCGAKQRQLQIIATLSIPHRHQS